MSFRQWYHRLESDTQAHLRQFVDGNGLVLFFKKDKDYYGAGEDSRVVFARLKNPDEDDNEGWEDEATFTAVNLTKLAHGEPSQSVFDKKDLKSIKVVDREEVVDKLKDVTTSRPKPEIRVFGIRVPTHHDRDETPNFVRTDEK